MGLQALGRGGGMARHVWGAGGRTAEPQATTCVPAPLGNSPVSAAHVATAGQTPLLSLSASKLQMTGLSVPKAALGPPAALPQPRDIPSPREWCRPHRGLEEAELLGGRAPMGPGLSHPRVLTSLPLHICTDPHTLQAAGTPGVQERPEQFWFFEDPCKLKIKKCLSGRVVFYMF